MNQLHCMGTLCRLKLRCARYTVKSIEGKYLAPVPYDPFKETCSMFMSFYMSDKIKSQIAKDGVEDRTI